MIKLIGFQPQGELQYRDTCSWKVYLERTLSWKVEVGKLKLGGFAEVGKLKLEGFAEVGKLKLENCH